MPALDPTRQRQFALDVVNKLRAAGYEAYWAGGCVRDQLLGRQPNDYDVATDARPEQIRKIFGRRRTVPIGASFGVITVVGPKPAGQIEVATFREDAEYRDGRRPESVTYTTAEHDAQRRDFTINGLFYDPVSDRVIDFVDGQRDLDLKRVRAIGNPRERFREDKLRLLRAIRFAATFQFQLDSETARAVAEMADDIQVVSAERIGDEMARMLVHATRERAVRLLKESRLLDVLLPELAAVWGQAEGGVEYGETPQGGAKPSVDESPRDSHAGAEEPRLQMTLRVLAALDQPTLAVALAALLHCAGDPSLAGAIGRRWRFPNKVTERAVWVLEQLPAMDAATTFRWPQLQRLLVSQGIDELITLYAAMHGETSPPLVRCREKLALPPEELNPAPLLSGDDLIKHGLPPGKAFRRLLEQVRDAQLEKVIVTRKQALELVDRILGEGG